MTAIEESESPALRRRLLDAMVRIRRVEEAIAARYPAGQMRCPIHLSVGQEAPAVGVCSALGPDDYALSTHRAHAHYLAKGGDLRALLGELYGKETGCSAGRGGSMHVIDLEANFLGATPIVGSSLPVGVGVAFGSVLRGDDLVTAVFFGDGATEEGIFSEALNFAALKALPIVFVCENNLYSVYSNLSVRQAARRDTSAIAEAHGVPALRGDGNDVEAVHALASAAVAAARRGEGPTFLELATYRWLEHCGPNRDNDIGYRTQAEFERWSARDPIERLRTALRASGELDDGRIDADEAEVAREIEAAFAAAEAAPFPRPERLLVDEYARPLR